jgi:IS5 family transposase
VKVTAENAHDVTVATDLLNDEEETKKNKPGKKVPYKINRRPSQSKNNSNRSKAQIKRREHGKSSVRVKAEHVFAVINRKAR